MYEDKDCIFKISWQNDMDGAGWSIPQFPSILIQELTMYSNQRNGTLITEKKFS